MPNEDERIYKYVLDPIDGAQHRTMPSGATFMHLATQRNQIAMWFRVDLANAEEERKFFLRGTGDNYPELGKHLGTVLLADGYLVLHVFEEVQNAQTDNH